MPSFPAANTITDKFSFDKLDKSFAIVESLKASSFNTYS